jgi:hypothetical protein
VVHLNDLELQNETYAESCQNELKAEVDLDIQKLRIGEVDFREWCSSSRWKPVVEVVLVEIEMVVVVGGTTAR